MVDGYLTDAEVHQKVVDLVFRARHRYGLPSGCTAEDACKRVGLSITCAPLDPDTDGLLSGDQVVLNSAITWPPRIQFTLFHELTHHLLDDDGELIEYFTERLRGNDRAFRDAVERCCHQGAAEFLIPRDSVREAIDSYGLSVELVTQLADRHGASIVASAIQAADCAPVPCYVTICAYGPLPHQSISTTCLYAEYSAASRSIRYPLARFTRIPEDHLFYESWISRCPMQGSTFVPFRSGKRMSCRGEAVCVGDRVIGLLLLRNPVPNNQLPLL